MSAPTKTCAECGRSRDCLLHMRAEFPPDAAEKWLRKTCGVEGKPCSFTYRAGFQIVGPIVGQGGPR